MHPVSLAAKQQNMESMPGRTAVPRRDMIPNYLTSWKPENQITLKDPPYWAHVKYPLSLEYNPNNKYIKNRTMTPYSGVVLNPSAHLFKRIFHHHLSLHPEALPTQSPTTSLTLPSSSLLLFPQSRSFFPPQFFPWLDSGHSSGLSLWVTFAVGLFWPPYLKQPVPPFPSLSWWCPHSQHHLQPF